MKILHVIANLAPRYGGPSKACLEMARAVARLGHNVSIYTTNQDGDTELDVVLNKPVMTDGVEITYFHIQCPRFWGTSLPMAEKIKITLRDFDIVHLHSLYMFHTLMTGYYCRKYGVPYIMRPHGTLDPYIHKRHRYRKKILESLYENKNIKHASAIHFTTDEEKRLAAPYIFNTPSFVVPLGLNLKDYEHLPEPGTFRARYPEIGNKKIILFLGRINFKKGLDILIRAFACIARKRNNVHLVIAGPDNDGYCRKVRAWVTDEGITARVTFTGMLLGDDKLAAFHDADIFVLPSYSENFGITVIEAMACGLPVIISNKVNFWREVERAGAGIVSACDIHEFTYHMLKILEKPNIAEEIANNGKKIMKKYSNFNLSRMLEKHYLTIVPDRTND